MLHLIKKKSKLPCLIVFYSSLFGACVLKALIYFNVYAYYIKLSLHLNLINCLQTPNNVKKLYPEKLSKVLTDLLLFSLSSAVLQQRADSWLTKVMSMQVIFLQYLFENEEIKRERCREEKQRTCKI